MKTNRRDIKKAAYDLMGIQGLESLHARTVAAELNINHATVHYYFRRRIDLLIGVAEHTLEQLKADRANFQAGLNKPTDVLEAELALAEAYCKKTSRFVKVLAGLYVASTSDPVLRKHLQAIWNEWLALVKETIPKAKLKRDTPYQDPEALLTHLFGIALASHMLDGKIDAKSKVDGIYASMFGS